MRAIIAIAGIIGISVIMAITTDFSAGSRKVTAVQPAKAADLCAITREQWDQVKMDMPVSRVITIIGCDGETVAESRFGGIDTKMVRYETASGRNVMLTFQNRRITMKTGVVQ